MKNVVDISCFSSGKWLEMRVFDGLRDWVRLVWQTVVVTLFFGIALTSCKENDDNPTATVVTVWLPESIFMNRNQNNPMGQHVYVYDCKNHIAKRTYHAFGIWQNDMILNNNAEGDLIEYRIIGDRPRDGSLVSFSQNDNKITFSGGGLLAGNVNGELELNTQGLPVKLTYERVTSSMSGGTEWIVSYDVTLIWQNGNLTKADWEEEYVTIRYYDLETWEDIFERTGESSAGTITFTYDEKKTPFYNSNTPKWFFLWLEYSSRLFEHNGWYNVNNIKTVTIENGRPRTYEYTYNDDGFPVTRTWGEETITTMEIYIYKSKELIIN